VSVQSEVNYSLKMLEYMRAGARVNSRVPVRLEWNEAGATHTVDGYTMDISPKGCMVIAPQGFAVGQKMRIKNGTNQKETEAILIWRGHEGRTGWELGLELVHPPTDFWGVEL
jgi:PilZ domain